MRYEVELTNQAVSDLRSIFSYIAIELQSVQNAAGLLFRLEREISSLDQMPERYRRYGKEPWKSRNLRVMTVERYCIFYIPDHTANIVRVLRVIYGGRDMDAQLKEYTTEES